METPFKKIGIIGKHGDDRVVEAINALSTYLVEKNLEVYLDKITAELDLELPHEVLDRQQLGSSVDLAVVIGGDGTLLNAARSLVSFEVPLLGINLGRLGFLTDVSPENLEQTLDEVFAGEYEEEPRGLLRTRIFRQGELINQSSAFNDVVVHKWNGARMLEYET